MKAILFFVVVIAFLIIALGLIVLGVRATRKTASIWKRVLASGLVVAGLLLLVALGLAWFNTTTFQRGIHAVAFSPDGRWLASGSVDHAIKLWDVTLRREVRTLTGHTELVFTVTFSPDGHWLASGSQDKTVKLWELNTRGEPRTLAGHTHWVRAVAFSPDGRWLASASVDHTIKLWEVATGRELRRCILR